MNDINSLPAGSEIHLVGIGGAGMRGLALLYWGKGFKVTGSDTDFDRPAIKDLINKGMVVGNGNDPKHLKNPVMVVYSTAIRQNNPELEEARRRGIPIYHRADAFKMLTKGKTVIGVAGTHGKTTSTAMATHICMKKGLNPTYYFGSPYLANKDQAEWTDGKVFIIETDEHDHSFLHFDVDIAIVGNIDNDHMENFNFDIKNLVADMEKYAQQSLDRGGWQILNADDKNVLSINLTHFKNVITFGRSVQAHLRAGETKFFRDGYNLCSETDVFWKGEFAGKMKLQVPGAHNVINALASIASLVKVGVEPKDAIPELADFPGTQRRIELMGVSSGHPVYDDYSHHPTAMIRGLETIRSYYPENPICLVLQPMRYSRVFYLPKEYSAAVRYANRVIITEINPSGEDNLWGSDINVLAKTIKEANPDMDIVLVPKIGDVPAQVKAGIKKDEIIYFSGPQTVRELAQPILDLLA